MTLPTEIKILRNEDQFQLLLPEPATDLLGLKGPDGKPLPIVNENRMQLEWLSHSIMKKYKSLTDQTIVTHKRLDVRKRWAAMILLACAVLTFCSYYLIPLNRVQKLYVTVSAFTIGIISCLQLLKYVAMGANSQRMDPSADLELIQLKEQIIKDFSIRHY